MSYNFQTVTYPTAPQPHSEATKGLKGQSNLSKTSVVKNSFAFKTIKYLLGHVNSNIVSSPEARLSVAQTKKNSFISDQGHSTLVGYQAADNLLFGNLAD